VELVCSVVWGQFHASSDVDFLIIDDCGISDGVIYEAVASKLDIRFDLMFLNRLRPVSQASSCGSAQRTAARGEMSRESAQVAKTGRSLCAAERI
jgi:hypothetical protein